MPNNQNKKNSGTKKMASIATTQKGKTSISKVENKKNESQNKKNTSTKVTTKKKNTIPVAKVSSNQKSSIKNSSKPVVKKETSNVKNSSKNKKTTKKVPKFSTIQEVKVNDDKKVTSKKKNVQVFNKVSGNLKKNNSCFQKIKNKINAFMEKKNDKKPVEKKNPPKLPKNILVKGNKKKNQDSHIQKRTSLFQKPNKWLAVVAIICGVIILLEGGYFIYHQIDIDKHSTYYDSLNSISVDDLNIVSVGSSNFKHSKYNSYTKGLEKAKFIKYDNTGKVLFEKMYERGINTTFNSIITVSDGYIAVGSGEFSEEEKNESAREAMIIKYDKDGNIVWEKFYHVVTYTRFNKVIETSDGYVAIGQSIYANMEMGNHTTGGGIIVKYDKDGNEIWHNNHGGMKSGNFNDIVEVDGNFYVVGKDATDSANIIKYDKDGKYQWHKNYSYTDGIGFTGITYYDNSLYVVGSKKILPEGTTDSDDRDTTNTDGLFIKYDLDGNIVFEKCFGGKNYERYNSILAYGDYLYVIGHTTSKDIGLKIDTDGELMTGILLRYDKNGNITKKEAFGGSNNDNLTSITTDGVSIYISGYSNSNDGNIITSHDNGKDYFGKVIKLDFKFRTLMIK